MGIEIERKFLVVSDAWRASANRSQRMAQGYINDQAAMEAGRQKASVRVRIASGQAWLNLKSRELGASRQEFEYLIPPADGDALLALCVGGRIDKQRHYVPIGPHTWEVDEFVGDNVGLVVAEIELGAVDERFERPAWLGREVTDELRFYNLALASRPFALWTDKERNGC